MDAPLDELYFVWLQSQVGSVKLTDPRKGHWNILRQLYKKEFVWLIPNDDNRAEDGRELRTEFMEQEEIDSSQYAYWLEMPCSFLEMLVGVARRLEFNTNEPVRNWFWTLMHNMGLEIIDGEQINEEVVEETLDGVIWRLYYPDGRGGLFPLQDPQEDQTTVEIWYQMNAYLLEQGGY